MKIRDFFNQVEEIKEAFEQASKDFECDEIELLFKADDGKITVINCIEGGYAPNQDTNVLVFSSGKKEVEEILKAMLGTPTIDANDIDIGAKLEGFINDPDH